MNQPTPDSGIKLPWRLDGLQGFTSSQGPTFDGGWFHGGGPASQRTITVRILTPMGRPATIEIDLTDTDRHGCTATLNPADARRAAAALTAAADKAEAEMAHWQQVLDTSRAEMQAAWQRDIQGRTGHP